MNKIVQFTICNIFKSKIIIVYSLLLALISFSTFILEDNATKGVLTLLNIILLISPLVSILFSTIYIYNSSEFIELLLSQPIGRKKIWNSLFAGVSLSLIMSTLIAVGIPLFLFVETGLALTMITMSTLITLVFTALAFLCSIMSRDKAKGIGIAIISWLFLGLLFDVIVLFLLFQFADYPIEKFAVGLASFNPIDLARILILLKLDVSVMMGYTGAIFKEFFGTSLGLIISFCILLLWVIIPFFISLIKFKNKDL